MKSFEQWTKEQQAKKKQESQKLSFDEWTRKNQQAAMQQTEKVEDAFFASSTPVLSGPSYRQPLVAPRVSNPKVKDQGNLLSMDVAKAKDQRAEVDEKVADAKDSLEAERKYWQNQKDMWANSQFRGQKWDEADRELARIDQEISRINNSTFSQDVINEAQSWQKAVADYRAQKEEDERLLQMNLQDAEGYAERLDELKQLLPTYENEMDFWPEGSEKHNAAKAEYDKIQGEIEQLEKNYSDDMIERAIQLKEMAQLESAARYVGFENMSKYDTTGFKGAEKVIVTGGYEMWVMDDEERTYRLINKDTEAIKVANANKNAKGIDETYLTLMTPEQTAIYNYWYKANKAYANEYLEMLKPELLRKQMMPRLEDWAATAEERPVAASAISVGLTFASLPAYIGQVADYIDDREIQENAAYNFAPLAQKTIRDTVGTKIEEKLGEKWGKAGSFAYQLGMSMADFLAVAGVGAGGMGTVILGGNAAAQTTLEAKARGLTDGQALALGTISGVAEWATETWSVEKLLDMTALGKSAGGYMLQNIAAEGSEEGISGLVNLFADILISKDKSQWQKAIDAYIQNDYDEKSAFAMALSDQVMAIGLDVIGGGISGGIMAGSGVAINEAAYNLSKPSGAYQQRQEIMDAIMKMAEEDGGFEIDERAAAGDDLPDGGRGRIPGQSAGEQSGTVRKTGTVDQKGRADDRRNRAAALGLQKVSGKEDGIAKTTANKTYSYMPETAWDQEMREVYDEVYQKTGKKVQYIIGKIEIDKGNGIVGYARGAWTTDGRIIVQADNDFTDIRSIAMHESFHENQFTQAELEQIYDKITRGRSKEELEALVRGYWERLKSTIGRDSQGNELTMEEGRRALLDEVFADANANMNEFGAGQYQKTVQQEAARLRAERETAAQKQVAQATQRTTGPPQVQQPQTDQQRADDILMRTLDEVQFSMDPAERERTINNLRSYLSGTMSKEELNQRIGQRGAQASQRAESSGLSNEAQKIKNAARQQRVSVEEYLRSNWEQYDVDGEWNPAAKEALQSERSSAAFSEEVERIEEQATNGGIAAFSMNTYNTQGKAALQAYLNGQVERGLLDESEARDMIESMDMVYEVCQQFKGKYAGFGKWSDAEIVTDEEGNPVMSVIVPNGEYPLNIDFSTICKKRKALNNVLNALISGGYLAKKKLNGPAIAKINKILEEEGFEIACALCFVDAKRYGIDAWAGRFESRWNSLIKSLGAEVGTFDFAGGRGTNRAVENGLDWSYVDSVLEAEKDKANHTELYRMAKLIKEDPTQRNYVKRTDLMASQGLDNLKKNNRAMYTLVNQHGGVSKPKISHTETPYLSQIIDDRRFTPENAFKVGGVRIQSFSDYMGNMFFDYVQMVGDLQAKRLPAHAYSKEIHFVKLFGLTGIKINMSLVPDYDPQGVAAGLDADGNYIWKDGQSFGSNLEKGSAQKGFETAIALQRQSGYDQNIGTIAVGVSDQHIRKMLDDPDIRMVIPYHKSGLSAIVAKMGNVHLWTDYTKVQNTRYQKENGEWEKLEKGNFDWYEDLAKTGDAKASAENYVRWCEDNGYLPKFDQFAYDEIDGVPVMKDGKRKVSENYFKLLIDFASYDSQGAYTPQQAVHLELPDGYEAIVEESLGETQKVDDKTARELDGVIERVAKELKLTRPDVAFSEEEPAEVARQMMANGASAKEIFDSTGLIVLASGTITNPETGEIIGRYDQDGTKGNERVSDGVFANAVSGQGGQSGRNLDGDRTEQSKEPRRSWNNLSSNQRRRIKDEVGQHLDNVNSDMIIAFRGLGNLETAQRIYTDLIVDQVNAEQWGRYIPDIDSLIRKMEGIISKDNAFVDDKEIEIVQTRERLAELENILFDGNDFGFSADEIRKLRNEYTKLNADYDRMLRAEQAATVKTPLKTILDNLQYYRRSDLESLAEQASDGAWDDYEDLTTEELIDGLREMIEGWELSPLEMQSAKYGLFVRPPAHNQTGTAFSEEIDQIEDDHEMAFDALLRDVEREQETQATRPERLEDTRRSLESYMDMQDRMWAQEAKEEQAAEKISAQFNRRPTSLREDLREAKSFFMRKMVDAGEAVARIGKAVGDKGLYHYYNLARASSNAAINMVADKRTDIRGNVTGDGLDKVLKTVREKGNDYYKRFQLYLYHMHNIDRMSREDPDRRLMAQAEFQEFTMTHPELSRYAEFQIEQMAANPNAELYIEAREYIRYRDAMRKAENTRNKPVFGFEVTAEDSRAIVQRLVNEHPEFAEEAQKVYDYIDNLLRYRVDSGLITEEDYEMLKSIYPHYVPTYRSFEWDNQLQTKQKGKVQIGKTIQRASGGDAKLMPLHKALSQQTMSVVREGSKNRFGQRLMQDNENGQAYEHIYNVAEYDNNFSENTFDRPEDEEQKKTNTFVVRQDGKLWELTISPALYEAVQALSPERDEANAAVRIIRKGNDLFKKLVTGYNPTFLVRNLLRDLQDAGFYSADLSEFVKQYPQAIREMQKDGKYWQQYKALGGTYSSVFDYETGDVDKGGRLKQNTIGRIEALNQAIEQAPRLAEFMATVKKAEKDHGQATMDDLMEAMYNAADITVNFGRAGTLGKKLNANLVPFLNPGIQGFSKMVRSVTETKGLKNWARLVAKAALFGVAPMLLNDLIYHDDEEWDDLKDRDKDVYYLFKIRDGLWLKLPKGRTLSLLGMTADRAVDVAKGEDVDWGGYIETLAQQSAPANPFENNILAAWFNTKLFDPDNPGETWYGTDIESQRLQNYAPGERYDASTDVFSKWLGKVTNLSPAKINYLLDQYTGVAGDVILPLLSPQAERDMFSAAFTIDSNYSNRFSNEFYEMADELTYRKNMPDATGVDNILNRFWSKQSTAISEVNKAIREIEADTELKNKDKKELTAAQYGIRNALMENALETLDAYKEAAEYYYNASTQADEDDRIDEAYRQANREIFGAEYAIKAYNKDAHETATEMLQNSGISFDAFYDFYFAQKDIEASGYEKNNEKRNLIMQSSLTDEQKEALYTKYVSDTRADDIAAFRDAGMGMDTFMQIQNQYAAIENMQLSSSEKRTEFSRWLFKQPLNAQQDAVASEVFSFYSHISAQESKYEQLINAGVSDEDAYSISNALFALEPEEGKDDVSARQKYKAIADEGLSDQDTMKAFSAVMTESEYKKVTAGFELALSPRQYANVKYTMPQFDENQNGSYSNAEVKAAIDAYAKKDSRLDNGDKAILWQMLTGNTSAKNNPYSRPVAERYLEELSKLKGEE